MPPFPTIRDLVTTAGGTLFERRSRADLMIRGLLWQPPAEVALRGGLLFLHGLQSNSLWISETAQFLAAKGFAVVAVDRRGSGLSDGHSGVQGAPRSPVSEIAGARGHHTNASEFLEDAEIGLSILQERMTNTGLPLHLVAQCFATRVAIPFLAENHDVFTSCIFLSPSTRIKKNADFSPFQKLKAIIRARFSKYPAWIDTPLQDDWFTDSPDQRQWIGRPEASLSLRSISDQFIAAVAGLSQKGRLRRNEKPPPLFLTLSQEDAIVDNEATIRCFQKNWQNRLSIEHFPGRHFIEFSDEARPQFHEKLDYWLKEHPG